MKSRLERYVENIVRHTECSKQEKEDLREELLTHLELSRDDFMKKGLTIEEAEKKAMELFGAEGEIGNQIQHSLFPYRKELMLTLAISSLLLTVVLYLARLFIEGDAHFVWLCFSMGISGLLLFLPLNQSFHVDKKIWLNSLLIIHTFGQLYGWLLSSQLQHDANVGLTIWVWLNMAIAIGLVYRTTIYDYHLDEIHFKFLHVLNITSGLIIIGISLFFLFGGLIMIGELHPMMLIFTSPILIWGVLYFIQLKLVKSNRKMAFTLGTIPFILSILILLWIYYPTFFL